jgi:hypothetical protein
MIFLLIALSGNLVSSFCGEWFADEVSYGVV